MELIKRYLTRNPCYASNVGRIDSRYARFQDKGPSGLMLHSVGCPQPSAEVFVNRWNDPSRDDVCVHGFVDANTGAVWQTLPWSYRAWHCGGAGNNTHIGVELCESRFIRYTSGTKFEVTVRDKARADCKRTYEAAVALFARLCKTYSLDPKTAVISHREGHRAGIASDHGDPEHYWSGLGMGYTMDGFRRDVAAVLDRAEGFSLEDCLPKGEADAAGGQSMASPVAENRDPAGNGNGTAKGDGASAETGSPAGKEAGLPFSDLAPGDWYGDALLWCVDKGLLGASPGAAFRPGDPCTRATLVVLLRRLYLLLQKENNRETP